MGADRPKVRAAKHSRGQVRPSVSPPAVAVAAPRATGGIGTRKEFLRHYPHLGAWIDARIECARSMHRAIVEKLEEAERRKP